MSNGVLQFSLGLQASKFIDVLSSSKLAVGSFTTAMTGVGIMAAGMFNAIERGSALNDLAARTGESVENLYLLEEGFKRAGLGAEAVDPMIQKVRKALSGVNEMGGNTDSIFAALGLDRASLAQKNPVEVIQKIAEAMHKLNPNDMAGAAAGLFGRGGAGDMIQLANSAEDMAVAFAHGRVEAKMFAMSAGDFDHIGDSIVEIKSHVQGLFTGLASSLTPEIIKVVDDVNDFSRHLVPAFAQALKNHDLENLIELSLMAGVEKGKPYFVAFATAFSITLTDAIVAALKAAAEIGGASFLNNIITAAKAGKNSDDQTIVQNDMAHDSDMIRGYAASGNMEKLNYWKGRLAEDIATSTRLMDEQKAIEDEFRGIKKAIVTQAIDSMTGTNLVKIFADAFHPDTSGPTPASDALLKKIADLENAHQGFLAGLVPDGSKKGQQPGQPIDAGGKQYGTTHSEWEKLGLIIAGGGDRGDGQLEELKQHREILGKCSTHLATIAGWDWKSGSILVNG